MRVVLGVDGGSSKTHAVLVDETGRLLGFGKAGIANQHTDGLESGLREVTTAVRMALQAAQLQPQDVELGCFCLAGADVPEDFRILKSALEALNLARRVVVKNDTAAGLRSGLTRSWGVVIICGTGFNAAGRGRDGKEIGLPSLGPLSGDWGGGGTLGVEAVGAVMRAWDGRGQPTMLTRLVLDALHVANEEELLMGLHLYNGPISREHILALTPLIFEAAEAGDQVARELAIRMGTEVGVTANVFLRRLDLADTDAEVVLAGSVFKAKGSLLIDTATRIIHDASPQARIVRPRFEPVAGAALSALEMVGVQVTAEINKKMEDGPLAISHASS
jgi:N-acetylglucosamine kinase-like BadF-type ATPase